nr:DUF3649 domain-containing protein [Azomonas macrocytogenes]
MDIGLRVAAATIGGYFFTYACTAAMARLLPLARFDAVMVSSLLAFAVYTAVIVWVFAAASAWRAWLGIALALPLAIIGFWPGLFGSGA